MIRVDIESIVMAAGPVPSVVVLRERKGGAGSGAPLRALSIQTGAYEAAAIGGGMDSDKATPRPIAHDVMLRTVQELGAKIERVEINRWEAPVFYADVVLDRGGDGGCRGEGGTDGEGRDGDMAEYSQPRDQDRRAPERCARPGSALQRPHLR